MRATIILGLLLAVVSPAWAELRVGAAVVKITPPVGIGMAGYYYERGAQGTNDDLYAKAIVLQDGEVRVALVGLDLISTTRPIVEEARKLIEQQTGIPGANVMISATHAHTGPVLVKRGARESSQGGSADVAVSYSTQLPGLIAQAVKDAAAKLEPVTALVGLGREEHLSHNRRYHMKDGTVGWNPGKKNPNIIKPAGPIDPDVGVVLFEGAKGKAIATYVNFAMHPDTVGGMHFSADYAGVLSKLLCAYKGQEMVTVFANGCCGNINHIDVNWAGAQKGYEEASRIGTVLAAAVMQTYKKVEPAQGQGLRVRSRIVQLPLPSIVAEEVAKSRETVELLGMKDNKGFMEKVQAYKVLDVAAREGKLHEVEVQVIALGDQIAWVSMPGEVFVELGLMVKEFSPFKYTMIAELANGSIGYIPNKPAYAQGAYEVVSARCAEGSGEMLAEAAVQLLGELKR